MVFLATWPQEGNHDTSVRCQTYHYGLLKNIFPSSVAREYYRAIGILLKSQIFREIIFCIADWQTYPCDTCGAGLFLKQSSVTDD